jgi:hypothetical protein
MPPLYHGTLSENIPAILRQGLMPGSGWGGAGSHGVFLSGTPEGALYWAKIAYQRLFTEKFEIHSFDRLHGHEVGDLLAIVVVDVPDSAVHRLKADVEQFEDVGARFSTDDWEESLRVIGDVRFDGHVPAAWVRDIVSPA